MSTEPHAELINVLSPDLYLHSVPPELSYFRARVFQAKVLGMTTLSLDAYSKTIAIIEDVPSTYVDVVAKSLFVGLEKGLSAGLRKMLTDARESDDEIPF